MDHIRNALTGRACLVGGLKVGIGLSFFKFYPHLMFGAVKVLGFSYLGPTS